MTDTNLAFVLPETPALELVRDLLDRTMMALARKSDVERCVRDLMSGLSAARRSLGNDWPLAVDVCRDHPLYAVFSADPLTARARSKPRGYAGDAVMIDYIYRGIEPAERFAAGRLGGALFDATTKSPSAIAVCARRDLLTERIDACADRVSRPRILSLACGHLREAAKSTAIMQERVGHLSAIDQDWQSIAVVKETYGAVQAIVPTHGSVRDVLRGKLKLENYDLVYAAGLYDYLPDAVATKLTRKLFDGLARGGELLIGNFAPDYATIGYTEAFMDWHLLCRSEEELASLAKSIPEDAIASQRTHTDSERCISYLSVTRR